MASIVLLGLWMELGTAQDIEAAVGYLCVIDVGDDYFIDPRDRRAAA